MYKLIRDYLGFHVLIPAIGLYPPIFYPIKAYYPQSNDATTPWYSAMDLPSSIPMTYTDKNHVTIIRDTAQDIVNEGLTGALFWRLR